MACKCTCGGCDCPQVTIQRYPWADASPARGFAVINTAAKAYAPAMTSFVNTTGCAAPIWATVEPWMAIP